MIWPRKTGEQWLLDLVPSWQQQMIRRAMGWPDSYLQYGDNYITQGIMTLDVNGWTAHELNIAIAASPSFPFTVTEPVVSIYYSGGLLEPVSWPEGQVPRFPSDWANYYTSVAFSIFSGQMQGIALAIQALRFTKGHFGRPNKED